MANEYTPVLVYVFLCLIWVIILGINRTFKYSIPSITTLIFFVLVISFGSWIILIFGKLNINTEWSVMILIALFTLLLIYHLMNPDIFLYSLIS